MPKIDNYDADALAEAWRVSGLTGDEYVNAAHDYICHWDGEAHPCTSHMVTECKPDRTRRNMLDLANDTRADGDALSDMIDTWYQSAAN